MRALFVTNQHKTEFYSALARRMEDLGATMHWISVGERWTRMLLADGWPRERILSLADYGREWEAPYSLDDDDRERLHRIETTAEAGLKNILIMDRELNRRPGMETEAYLAIVTREIERFVVANRIRTGFGEPTWAPEMLTSEVLRAQGGRYLMHHTIRIPSSRLAFYEGIFHDRVVALRQPTDADREIARDAIAAVRDRAERPYYFARNMNPQRLYRKHWLGEAAEALIRPAARRYDHTVPDLLTRSTRRIKVRLRASRALASNAFEAPPQPTGRTRPYVLVLLHKQPEASVDVLGAPFNNQLEVVRALARSVPFEWEIWVKEHGHAVGDRSVAYYDELRALPGLRVIEPSADTLALIRGAGLVASVAGTASFEAAVMGVPAITFGRMYFAPVMVADRVDPFALDVHGMAALLERAAKLAADPGHAMKVENFITWLVAQSFEGKFSDPLSDPDCMSETNIDRVAGATIAMMQAREPPATNTATVASPSLEAARTAEVS